MFDITFLCTVEGDYLFGSKKCFIKVMHRVINVSSAQCWMYQSQQIASTCWWIIETSINKLFSLSFFPGNTEPTPHSPYCPTCGCPSPMASPVHSSAPTSPAPQSPSTPSSSNPAGSRVKSSKRKRLASITDDDETDSNNNNASDDVVIEVVNCDEVLANHLRHMEARQREYEEFQGQLPSSRCKPPQHRVTRGSDRGSGQW